MFVVKLSDGETPVRFRAFSDRSGALKWGGEQVEGADDVSRGDLFEVVGEADEAKAIESVKAGGGEYLEPIPFTVSVDRADRIRKREAQRFLAGLNIVVRR
jgi:hypothetical protein